MRAVALLEGSLFVAKDARGRPTQGHWGAWELIMPSLRFFAGSQGCARAMHSGLLGACGIDHGIFWFLWWGVRDARGRRFSVGLGNTS